jgi:membrane protease YdiL (CAAX protease family)/Flp pilus assembly protein TadD
MGWCLLLGLLAGLAFIPSYVVVHLFLSSSPAPVRYFVTGSLATFVAAVCLVGRLSETQIHQQLALRPASARHLLLVVFLAPPLALLSTEAANGATRFFPSGISETATTDPAAPPSARVGLPGWEEMVREMARQPWWLILLAGCLLPALGEEAFCRGFLGRGLVARYGPVLGVLLTSLLFGLLHIDPVHACATAVGGIGLHVVYLTTRSLWAPILLHALHNALMFAETRLAQDTHLDLTGQYEAPHLAPSLVLAAAAAVSLLFFLFYRTRTRWLRPDGEEWSPGYVSAEMPPPGVEATACLARPGRGPLLGVAAGYLAFAGVALSHAFPGTPRGAWGYVERGNQHLKRGELDDAIADYTEAIRLVPNDPSAYFNRGLARFNKGQHAEALPDFDRAIELDPKMADAYLYRGMARHNLRRHDKALADYSQALRLDPEEVLAYTNRARIRFSRQDLDGALADLDEALRRKPVADTLVLRGHLHLRKDAADKAIRDFTEAIRTEPRNAVAFYLRGFAYQARGEDARALDDFKEAARLDPNVAKRFE